MNAFELSFLFALGSAIFGIALFTQGMMAKRWALIAAGFVLCVGGIGVAYALQTYVDRNLERAASAGEGG